MKLEDKDWYDNIIESMKGSERAQPNTTLFNKVEDKLSTGPKVIAIYQLRWAVAVAVLLIVFNTWSINRMVASNKNIAKTNTTYTTINLVSNYNFYQ